MNGYDGGDQPRKVYFYNSVPEFTGNIFTDRDKSPIRDQGRNGRSFVAFKVASDSQRGDESSRTTKWWKVIAGGRDAEFILSNPDFFHPGAHVRVRGQMYVEEREAPNGKRARDMNGNEVVVQDTFVDDVVVVDSVGHSPGFIAPCFKFERRDGGQGGGGNQGYNGGGQGGQGYNGGQGGNQGYNGGGQGGQQGGGWQTSGQGQGGGIEARRNRQMPSFSAGDAPARPTGGAQYSQNAADTFGDMNGI